MGGRTTSVGRTGPVLLAAGLVVAVVAGASSAGSRPPAPAAADAVVRLDGSLLDDPPPAPRFGPTRATEAAIRATARPDTTSVTPGLGSTGPGGSRHRFVH